MNMPQVITEPSVEQVSQQFKTEELAPRTEIWQRGLSEERSPTHPVSDCPSCPSGN